MPASLPHLPVSIPRRALPSSLLPAIPRPQRRWAQVHNIRYISHQQTSARILDKYRGKLDAKAREKGIGDWDALRRLCGSDGVEAGMPFRPPPPPTTTVTPPDGDGAGRQSEGGRIEATEDQGEQGVKTLSHFLDVTHVSQLPTPEIETLWRSRHARDPRSVCAVLSTQTFNRLVATARQHPRFVLPLPRPGEADAEGRAGEDGRGIGGAEIHYMQWTFPSATTVSVLFTHLAEFKLRGEFAVPHTTVTFHLDLAMATAKTERTTKTEEELDTEKKGGVILMEGRVSENRGVEVEHARFLLMCLQKFYAAEAGSPRRELLERFSRGDETFRVEQVMDEAEKVP